VQQSQDNRDHMVKKLEKGSTITRAKLPQINLKTSYQTVDKTKIKTKAHVKCLVKKLEKGSTITRAKLPQMNLKTSYQKVDKTKVKKKAHVKCFE
jgi:hypothetical protein